MICGGVIVEEIFPLSLAVEMGTVIICGCCDHSLRL
jgi:hypothetical protein